MQKHFIFVPLLLLCLLTGNRAFSQQFTYFNSFKTDDATGLVLGESAKLTSGNGDPAGEGVLRLTENNQILKGYCYINQDFPAQKGLKVEFEYFTHGGNLADGITFFLFDPSNGFEIGQYGGALGYAQNATGKGMKGGFLAIGLDEFGNFGIASENKNGGFVDINNKDYGDDENIHANGLIVVRGGVGPAGERDGSTAYPFIGGKITNSLFKDQAVPPRPDQILPDGDQFSIATDRRATKEIEPEYRRVKLDIEKLDGTNTGFRINVHVFVGGPNARWIKVLENIPYLISDSRIPNILRGGFSASTGDQYNYHEIRNFSITPAEATLKHPVANDDPTVTILNNQTATIKVLDNDVTNVNDKDKGKFFEGSLDLDPTTPIIDNSITIPDKGTFTVDDQGTVTFTPLADFIGTVTATYTFKDNFEMLSNTATIAVKVNEAKPTVSDIAKPAAPKNKVLSFVSSDFSNSYSGTSFTKVQLYNLPDATTRGVLRINNGGGSFTTVSENQEIAFADLAKIEFVPATNYVGLVTFTWNGSNGVNYADNAKTVSMTFVNTAPVVTNTSETVTKNVTLNPFVNTSFTGQYIDADDDGLVQVKITQLPVNGTIQADKGLGLSNLSINDIIPLAKLSTIQYVPNTGNTNADSFKWQAFDGTDYSGNATVTLTIVNSTPVIKAITKTVNEDQVLSLATDFSSAPSYTDASGNLVTKVQISGLPVANGILRLNNNNVYSPVANNQEITAADLAKLEFVPNKDYNGGPISFKWNAYNGYFYAASPAVIDITVNPVNDAPAFTKGQDQVVTIGATAQTVANWAKDMNVGPANESTQTYSFSTSSSNSSLFDVEPQISTNGTLTYTPKGNVVGKATIKVILKDNGGTANGGVDQSEQSFEITIKPIGQPDTETTTINTAKPTNVKSNDGASGTIAGIVVIALPSAKQGTTTVDNSTGNVTYTPPLNYVGKDSYTYTLAKDGATSDPITVNVDVKPVGRNDNDYVQKNSTVTTNVKTNDGPSAVSTTVVVSTNPTNGTISIVSNTAGTIKYTPNSNFAGTDSYTYKLVTTDGVESDPVTVTIGVADLQVQKTVKSISDGTKRGSVITYEIVVKNTGSVTLSPVTVADAKAPITAGSTIFSLAPGASMPVITTTYTITQADIDAGKVSNVAVASGTTPTGSTFNQTSDADLLTPALEPTETIIPSDPQLSVFKKVTSLSDGTKLNSIITYEIQVKNTGNVTLSPVIVADIKAPITSGGTIAKLEVGATEIITTTYKITQADIDAGKISNVATATGTPPVGAPIVKTSDSDLLTPALEPTEIIIPSDPKLSVLKTVRSLSNGTKAGSIITYDIQVKNTGNVTLSPVTVTDIKAPITSGGTIAKLDVGATAVVSTTYTITQADVDAGFVSNVAEATGTPPVGTPVVRPSDSDLSTPTLEPTKTIIPAEPKLSVFKTVKSLSDGTKLGSVITYEIKVKNTGNVTLSQVEVKDIKAPITTGGTIPTLAPGDNMPVITTSYTITQADIDAGKVSNVAVATGVPPIGQEISQPSDSDLLTPAPEPTETIITSDPKFSVFKKVKSLSNGTKLGSIITYEIEVKNTGNVGLSQVEVKDAKAPITTGGAIASLAPGASMPVITTTYAITQADIDAGKVSNVAVATGTPPVGSAISQASDADLLTPALEPTETVITPAPSLSVFKKVKSLSDGTKLGSVITYEIQVTNTGNVTLSPVVVADAKAPITSGGTIAKLEVGATEVITTTYKITQADIDAGKISNVATATGTPPFGTPVLKSSDSDLSTPALEPTEIIIPSDPQLSVFKKVRSLSNGTKMGSIITYDIQVKNTGNVTLSPVTVTDIKAPITSGGTIARLDVGATAVVSTTYTITQADVDAGFVSNIADVNGITPKNATVTCTSDDPDTATPLDATITTIPPLPSLQVRKTVTSSGLYKVGSVIVYNIEVTNTGNVTLSGLQLTDDNATITAGEENIGLLAPGATKNIVVRHLVTQGDVDAAKVTNQAFVTGKTPDGNKIKQDSDDPTTRLIPDDPTAIRVGILDPKAVNDNVEVKINSEVTIAVLDNDIPDTGLKLDPLSVEIVNQPLNGTVKVNADGTVTFIPNKNFIGADEFTYRMKDDMGNASNLAVVTIKVTGFIVPNVFTPNGDGKNDTFVIAGLENYDSADLTVFNRWGNEVYRSSNYQNNWTGEGLNAGTYYFVVKLRKGTDQDTRKGWVLLKR